MDTASYSILYAERHSHDTSNYDQASFLLWMLTQLASIITLRPSHIKPNHPPGDLTGFYAQELCQSQIFEGLVKRAYAFRSSRTQQYSAVTYAFSESLCYSHCIGNTQVVASASRLVKFRSHTSSIHSARSILSLICYSILSRLI